MLAALVSNAVWDKQGLYLVLDSFSLPISHPIGVLRGCSLRYSDEGDISLDGSASDIYLTKRIMHRSE